MQYTLGGFEPRPPTRGGDLGRTYTTPADILAACFKTKAGGGFAAVVPRHPFAIACARLADAVEARTRNFAAEPGSRGVFFAEMCDELRAVAALDPPLFDDIRGAAEYVAQYAGALGVRVPPPRPPDYPADLHGRVVPATDKNVARLGEEAAELAATLNQYRNAAAAYFAAVCDALEALPI